MLHISLKRSFHRAFAHFVALKSRQKLKIDVFKFICATRFTSNSLLSFGIYIDLCYLLLKKVMDNKSKTSLIGQRNNIIHGLSQFCACHNTVRFCLETDPAIHWQSTCHISLNLCLIDRYLCPSSLFSVI